MEFLGDAVAYRGLFLIDKQGVVRHQVVNDEPFGRNIDEALRMVDALQHHEEHGELCPANWRPGDPTLKETPESIADYLSKRAR
jgi:peroxiredoxin (alkyl hydroperoxide reductase subunit C)